MELCAHPALTSCGLSQVQVLFLVGVLGSWMEGQEWVRLAWGLGQTHTLGAEKGNETSVATGVTHGSGERQELMGGRSHFPM